MAIAQGRDKRHKVILQPERYIRSTVVAVRYRQGTGTNSSAIKGACDPGRSDRYAGRQDGAVRRADILTSSGRY